MTLTELYESIGVARKSKPQYSTSTEPYQMVSDSLSLLHWFWSDPYAWEFCLSDDGAKIYTRTWGRALDAIKSHPSAVLIDGIFWRENGLYFSQINPTP